MADGRDVWVPLSRWRRVVQTLLALVLIYGNVAVIFHSSRVWFDEVPSLPRPFVVHDAFIVTGMFSQYSTANRDFFIEGRLVPTAERRHGRKWISLHLDDHFPYRHGVTFTLLGCFHHWDMRGKAAQRRCWQKLAVKIRQRHNRLHPRFRVRRVRFGAVRWPLSPKGYRALKKPKNVQRSNWYLEPKR